MEVKEIIILKPRIKRVPVSTLSKKLIYLSQAGISDFFFILVFIKVKVWFFQKKTLSLINSQNVPVYLFLCEPQVLLCESQCNFISQRTTEKLHRESQREFS